MFWARRMAWGLVLLVLGSWLAALAASGIGAAPRLTDPTAVLGGTADPVLEGGGDEDGTGGPDEPLDAPRVVLVGIPNLTWDLISRDMTPTMSNLAGSGGSAALVLRGTHEVTCVADAWLTLGAGQRAAADVAGCGEAGSDAAALDDLLSEDAVDGEAWSRWQEAAADRSLRGELGTLAALAEAGGTCVSASSGPALLGATDADGEARLFGEDGNICAIHLVSAAPVAEPEDEDVELGSTGNPVTGEKMTEAAADRVVSSALSGLGPDSTLVVVGMGHTSDRAEAMALIVVPAEDARSGLLSSGSTRQEGLVQLTDLTPTLLDLAGIDPADVDTDGLLAGQPVTIEDATDDRQVEVARDLSTASALAKSSVLPVIGILAALVFPLLLLTALLRRGAWFRAVVTFAMAVPVATFLAGLVPWWRAGSPVTMLTLGVVAFAVVVALVGLLGPWRTSPLGPPAAVAALTLAVLGVDLLWSARLGLVSVLGLQPLTAGRFYGQGNVGYGIALGSFVVLAAALLTWLRPDGGNAVGRAGVASPGARAARAGRDADAPRPAGPREAALAVGLLGLAFLLLGAAPMAGADFGSVPSTVVAAGLLLLVALGVPWSARNLLGLAAVAVVVAALAMVLDWLRGAERRTHLGDFVQSVIDGDALGIVGRKLDQSLGILLDYPLSWLAVLALVLVAVVVIRRPAWSAPLWEEPGTRPAFVAGLVAIVLAWALNDSGIAVVALALAMLVAAALHVLGRSLARR